MATDWYADQVTPPSFEKRISVARGATTMVRVTARVLQPTAPSSIETAPVPTGGGAAAASAGIMSKIASTIARPIRAVLLAGPLLR